MPLFALKGVSHYLFPPLAEAIIFAMLASYALSRTLVPTMAMYLLKAPNHNAAPSRNPLVRMQKAFDRGFEQVRRVYEGVLRTFIRRRRERRCFDTARTSVENVHDTWIQSPFVFRLSRRENAR
jgi:multidrug efflux pump subunit AcrB